MRTHVFLLGILLILTLPAMAERFVSCHDGDTCTLESGLRVRLSGIDAPELGQPFAGASRDALATMLLGKDANLTCTGWSYERRVCAIAVEGVDLQERLVEQGLAYDYTQYSGGKYQQAQAFAQANHLGVWTLPDGGLRPWDNRHPRPTPQQSQETP